MVVTEVKTKLDRLVEQGADPALLAVAQAAREYINSSACGSENHRSGCICTYWPISGPCDCGFKALSKALAPLLEPCEDVK
jgi:hypothetical protein